eukprot:2228719-Pyramimonas_sp.AAC.1
MQRIQRARMNQFAQFSCYEFRTWASWNRYFKRQLRVRLHKARRGPMDEGQLQRGGGRGGRRAPREDIEKLPGRTQAARPGVSRHDP